MYSFDSCAAYVLLLFFFFRSMHSDMNLSRSDFNGNELFLSAFFAFFFFYCFFFIVTDNIVVLSSYNTLYSKQVA